MTGNCQYVDVSRTIQTARVVCIFFMMYAHVGGYDSATLAGRTWETSPLGSVAASLHEFFARASVPLLSSISGWLFSYTYSRNKGILSTAIRKSKSLLVPMVVWNLLLIIVYLVAGQFISLQRTMSTSVMDWIDDVLAITRWPCNIPLYFLRDLFLSTLVGAAVLSATSDRRSIWIITIVIATLIVVFPVQPLLLEPLILVQFLIGIAVQRSWDVATLRSTLVLSAIGLFLLSVHLVLSFGHDRIDQMIFRLSTAAIGWVCISHIAGWTMAAPIVKISPAIFLVFCMHNPIFIFGNGAIKRLTGTTTGHAWTVYYFIGPFLALAIGVAAYTMLRHWAPWLLAALTGDRLSTVKPGRVAAGEQHRVQSAA